MVEIETVANTIVMLAVAFGVGLIGGLGAAFIEWRKQRSEGDGKSGGVSLFWNGVACVVIGGIAAVAALYFFAPTETVPVPGEPEKTVTSYDLVKLVALSLLIGSAGTAVLQSLQGRFAAQLEAEKATQGKEATQATADQALAGVIPQAERAANAGVEAAASQIQAELQKHQGLSSHDAQAMVGKLAEDASKTVAATLAPQLDAAKQMVAAAAEPTSSGDS